MIQGNGTVVYNTKLKKWIMMSTAAQPLTSATPEYPHGQYDKQLRDKVLAYKGPPRNPQLRHHRSHEAQLAPGIQHRSRRATARTTISTMADSTPISDCGWDDQLRLENHQRPYSNALMIVDMSDPSNVKEVSRWWVPGQRLGEEDEYKKYRFAGDQTSWTGNHGALTVPKRVEDGGTYRLWRLWRLRHVRHGFVRHQAPQALWPHAI